MFNFFRNKKQLDELQRQIWDLRGFMKTNSLAVLDREMDIQKVERAFESLKDRIEYLETAVRRLSGPDYHGIRVDGQPRLRPGRKAK